MRCAREVRSLESPDPLGQRGSISSVAARPIEPLRGHLSDARPMEEAGNIEEMAAEEVDLLEDAEQVHLALGCISLAHREVLTLYFLEDLSQEQMADVLGIRCWHGSSRRLSYAKRALRSVLQHEEGVHESNEPPVS